MFVAGEKQEISVFQAYHFLQRSLNKLPAHCPCSGPFGTYNKAVMDSYDLEICKRFYDARCGYADKQEQLDRRHLTVEASKSVSVCWYKSITSF